MCAEQTYSITYSDTFQIHLIHLFIYWSLCEKSSRKVYYIVKKIHRFQYTFTAYNISIFTCTMTSMVKVQTHWWTAKCSSHSSLSSVPCFMLSFYLFWRKSQSHSAARMKSWPHFIFNHSFDSVFFTDGDSSAAALSNQSTYFRIRHESFILIYLLRDFIQ